MAPAPPELEPLPCDCQTRPVAGGPCPERRQGSFAGGTVQRDARPVVLIACMNGTRRGPRLWANWWNQPDGEVAVFNLMRALNNAYARGFRRMVLYMPAGQEARQPEGALFSSSQYWPIPSGHKRALGERLRPWIAAKERAGDPVSLGVYAGSPVARDVNCLSMDGCVPLDPSDASHLRAMYQNVRPWAELGAREYWLDYAATTPCIVGALQSHPAFEVPGAGVHVRFGGEAIPYAHETGPGGAGCREKMNAAGQHVPDAPSLRESPWLAAFSFVQDAFPAKHPWGYEPDVWAIADPSGGLSPADTELGVLIVDRRIRRDCTVTLDDAARLFHADNAARPWTGPWRDDAGWVLWAGNEDLGRAEYPRFYRYMEIVQRVYDMGTISCAADYNADGSVNDADLEAARAAVKANRGTAGATYLMGDFDRDGAVTDADFARFREWWESATGDGEYSPVDLGAPGPG